MGDLDTGGGRVGSGGLAVYDAAGDDARPRLLCAGNRRNAAKRHRG